MSRRTVPSRHSLALLLAAGCSGELYQPSGPGAHESEPDPANIGIDPASIPDSPVGDELAEHCDSAIEPGRALLHRLTRLELGYTLSDLTGLTMPWSEDFPADESAAGFDNQASALAMSLLHVEKYFDTASKVVTALLADPSARARALGELDDAADAGAVTSALAGFAERAYRRPLQAGEAERLVALFQAARSDGATFDVALSVPLRAILASPHFVFHRPTLATDQVQLARFDHHAIAERLSYFLWSSLPDAGLRAAADQGKLQTPEELEAQVTRMLADAKAERFVENFAGQWLDLRALHEARPDPERFPAFSSSLRTAMADESYGLMRNLLAPGRDVRELLSGGYSYLTRDLAEHYGLDSAGLDDTPRRSELTGSARIGFLTHGSFLTLTSHPERTSLVKRGKWVLEQLLCSPPPPPPPGVEALPVDEPGADQEASLREQVERHRQDPACAGCHTVMDPIGFGLEHFDAVGAYREEDQGFAIDASGELPRPGGKILPFDGAAELSRIVAEDPRLTECIAEKVFTFALKRSPLAADACTVEALEARLSKGRYSLFDLIVSTTQVPAFTHTSPEVLEE